MSMSIDPSALAANAMLQHVGDPSKLSAAAQKDFSKLQQDYTYGASDSVLRADVQALGSAGGSSLSQYATAILQYATSSGGAQALQKLGATQTGYDAVMGSGAGFSGQSEHEASAALAMILYANQHGGSGSGAVQKLESDFLADEKKQPNQPNATSDPFANIAGDLQAIQTSSSSSTNIAQFAGGLSGDLSSGSGNGKALMNLLNELTGQ